MCRLAAIIGVYGLYQTVRGCLSWGPDAAWTLCIGYNLLLVAMLIELLALAREGARK